jgi:subtilisin family serine protease
VKRLTWLLTLAFAIGFASQSASAQLLSLNLGGTSGSSGTRLIVRDTLGLSGLNLTCLLAGCQVQQSLGDPDGQLFLVTLPSVLNPATAILQLLLQPGIAGVEIDQPVSVQGSTAGTAPYYLSDKMPVNYYGTTVWNGYLTQPAVQLIRSGAVHSTLQSTGAGVTVAVIDTGVDTTSTVLAPFLVKGYDFTRNKAGGSESGDVTQSTVAVLDGGYVGVVNQSTVAVLDQSTVAVLDQTQYAAFGHGTMTSGIVHLVAPQSRIMPLKAFGANGTGYASDVLRAIYYAVNNGAHVLNMSFDFTSYSPELQRAVNYATGRGAVCVASAGNDGQQRTVYPAALPNVIDVASTSNNDTQSSFTNYGAPPVLLGAPGEGIMTTYPFQTYAAGWGTSFSAPLVSGTVAVMVGQRSPSTLQLSGLTLLSSATTNSPTMEFQMAQALKYAQAINAPEIADRRLDAYQAVRTWQISLGLQ